MEWAVALTSNKTLFEQGRTGSGRESISRPARRSDGESGRVIVPNSTVTCVQHGMAANYAPSRVPLVGHGASVPSRVAQPALLDCVTTANLLPSSAKPVRALRIQPFEDPSCSGTIPRKQQAPICNPAGGLRRRPVRPSAQHEEKSLSVARRAPIPARMLFHAAGSESARDVMVPCARGLGSSLFDSYRARPLPLRRLCQDVARVSPDNSQRLPNLKEKHRSVGQDPQAVDPL